MSKPPKKAKSPAMPAAASPALSATNWEAHDALHTLKRAHAIKADPKLMHHVREHAKVERKALSKVIGRKA